ncbi:MAG: glycosyltransferase family 2 protein [Terriglobales bacterium]|jgi:dolichol-phosphate mannosyltransferase
MPAEANSAETTAFSDMSTSVPLPQPRIELAVVIPTYNEKENVPVVLTALARALYDVDWEVIIVDDDSPDGTAESVREMAATNPRIHVIERIGRRGLSSACIEGMLSTSAPYIAVIDADMQHDETVLPKMLEKIRDEHLDLVVASRNLGSGGMGEFSRGRVWLSNMGNRVSRLVCHCDISDAMSGFFVIDRHFFQEIVHRLTGSGFKILVDILASSRRPVRVAEVPYRFRNRARGESKLDVNVELEYLFLLIDKMVGNYVPTRFVLFVLVGSLGMMIHLSTLALLYAVAKKSFIVAQTSATVAAMTFNFVLNNIVTFRDRRLRGWRLLTGLLTFYAACSLGALMNVSFAEFLHRQAIPWYVAGVSGTAISSVWNYGVNTILTWRRSRY